MAPPSLSPSPTQSRPLRRYQQALQHSWRHGAVQRRTQKANAPLLWVQQDRGDGRVSPVSNEAQEIGLHLAERQRRENKTTNSGTVVQVDPARAAQQVDRMASRSKEKALTVPESLFCAHGNQYHSNFQEPGGSCLHCSQVRGFDKSGSPKETVPLATAISDSFTPSPQLPPTDSNINTRTGLEQDLLLFYLSTIIPAAKSLAPAWHWPLDLDRTAASRMLTSAVLAYAAAFAYQLEQHSNKSAHHQSKTPFKLSPNVSRSITGPSAWLGHQTNVVTTLLECLNDFSKLERSIAADCLQSAVILMRLALLLRDVETAQMHFEGVKRMIELSTVAGFDLTTDLKMWNMDLAQHYLRLAQKE